MFTAVCYSVVLQLRLVGHQVGRNLEEQNVKTKKSKVLGLSVEPQIWHYDLLEPYLDEEAKLHLCPDWIR